MSFGEEPLEVKFDDSPITFLVGPNNSGKSNIFRTLDFVGKAITGAITPSEAERYFGTSPDFEIRVETEIDGDELGALRDFLLCGNMTYRPGGTPEEQRWAGEVKNKILTLHGDKLFGSLGSRVTIVVKRTSRDNTPVGHSFRLTWGDREFLLQQDGYLANEEIPDTRSFGYNEFGVILVDDFKARYPPQQMNLGERWENAADSYEPPDAPDLLSSRLASAKNSVQSSFAGIQMHSLNFQEFDNEFGTTPPSRRLKAFLSSRGFRESTLSLGDFLAVLYAHSIVWMPDLHGRPPGYEFVPWEKPAERGDRQYYGRITQPKLQRVDSDTLASRLFELAMSSDVADQRRFEEIQSEFTNFTRGLRVGLYLDDVEVVDRPDLTIVRVPPEQQGQIVATPEPGFALLGAQGGESRKKVRVVRLRMIDGGTFWPVEFASAGTIETLTILTAVIGAKDRVMLLDEPTQNMHPEFQHRLLQLLRKHAEEDGNQYVVITHSPFLISRESLGTTWHVRRRAGRTRVSRVMDALAKLDSKLPQKMVQQFDSADIRSLLFSRGAVLVEGLSDKWVIQEMDGKAASAGKGPRLMENEWAVVAMNSSGNTATFVGAAETLGLDYAVLLDRDAQTIAEAILQGKGIFGKDENSLRENGFFILKGEIDELFGVKAPNKPLKALERTLAMEFDKMPTELREFFSYLEERMRIPPVVS